MLPVINQIYSSKLCSEVVLRHVSSVFRVLGVLTNMHSITSWKFWTTSLVALGLSFHFYPSLNSCACKVSQRKVLIQAGYMSPIKVYHRSNSVKYKAIPAFYLRTFYFIKKFSYCYQRQRHVNAFKFHKVK